MYSFIGDFDCRADAKNRVVLPSAFKHELEGGGGARLVIRKDIFEKCLNIYPYEVWEGMMADLRSRLNPYDRRPDGAGTVRGGRCGHRGGFPPPV